MTTTGTPETEPAHAHPDRTGTPPPGSTTRVTGRRIALLCDWCLPRFGGLELQLMGAANALRAAGHAVEIITALPGPALLDGIPVHRLRGARLPLFGVTCSPRQFREFRALLRAGSFDVVHVHSGLIAPLAYGCAAIAARAGVPTALTFHSVYSYLQPALAALARASGAPRLPIAWSAVSRYVADETSRALEGTPVSVLPNGIDPDRWRVAPHRRAVGELRVVSVLRLQVRKRPLALFDILDRARQAAGRAMSISLDIVGDGPQRAAVERRARAAGASRVRVHGRLTHDQIRALFGVADAFLLPTRLESFGIAALEARCAGVPVIARCDTGVEDFITHGPDGLLGASDAALAAALTRIARDEPLRASLAARCRQSTPHCTWSDVVAATMALHDRAVSLQAARASSGT